MMTSRERVLAAIDHRAPDRTPMDFGGTWVSGCMPPFQKKLRAFLGLSTPPDRDEDSKWIDEAIQQYLGVDLRLVPLEPPMAQLRILDEAAYERTMAARAAATSAPPALPSRTRFPWTHLAFDDIKKMRPTFPEFPYVDWWISVARHYREKGFATSFTVSAGFFEMGCWKRGYSQFALDLVDNQDLVRAMFDLWLEELLHTVKHVVKPLAPHIDLFCFGDDLGMQTGPFLSPRLYREMIRPYYIEYCGQIRHAARKSASTAFVRLSVQLDRRFDRHRRSGAQPHPTRRQRYGT